MRSIGRVGALTACAAVLAAAPAAAQLPIPTPSPPIPVPTVPGPSPGPDPQGYQANDGRGFRDILPPGTRGHYSAPELAAFLATGRNVPHCCDQLGMYGDLVYSTPGCRPATSRGSSRMRASACAPRTSSAATRRAAT